ncbi:helix-turn-helix transcriptional regulator [Lactobacillaceae bacterium L1_55_11]|nr:helix-turn-helix transcriptional regulator [Lactobacillaceae bacterium L1_55_11]
MENYFGKNLRYLRNKNGLSQAKMGCIFHVGQQAIASWESGKRFPDVFTISEVAEYFDVNPFVLVHEPIF